MRTTAPAPTMAAGGDPELEALGLLDERAEAFLKGRAAAGARARRGRAGS